jgi:hypothetical protein
MRPESKEKAVRKGEEALAILVICALMGLYLTSRIILLPASLLGLPQKNNRLWDTMVATTMVATAAIAATGGTLFLWHLIAHWP